VFLHQSHLVGGLRGSQFTDFDIRQHVMRLQQTLPEASILSILGVHQLLSRSDQDGLEFWATSRLGGVGCGLLFGILTTGFQL